MLDLIEIAEALKFDAPPLPEEEEYLRALEAAAVAYVERATGRRFGAVGDVTEYLTGSGQREVWLSERPTGAVTVLQDGAAVDAGDFTVRERRLRHVSAWGSADVPVDLAITYPTGYTAGAEPADIRQAVSLLVAHWYEQRIPVAVGTVAPEVAFTVRDLLAPWRRWLL